MASLWIAGWRRTRGEPQAEQRPARSGTSLRQSRQKPGMVLPRVVPSLTAIRVVRSRRVPLQMAAGDGITRSDHRIRINLVVGGEGQQQRLVARDVVEHAGKELRLARGIADGARTNSGYRQKAAEPLGLGGDESKRRDRELFGRRLPFLAAGLFRLAPISHRNLRAADRLTRRRSGH